MSDLFMKEVKDGDLEGLLKPRPVVSACDEFIVFGGGYDIYYVDDLNAEPELLRCRDLDDDEINGFHLWGDVLFDFGVYGVFETVDNSQISNKEMYSFCVHEGLFYHSDLSGNVYTSLSSRIVSSRDDKMILGFCEYEGKLYDFGEGGVFETLSGKRVSSRLRDCRRDMCEYEGILYDVGDGNGVDETFTDECFKYVPYRGDGLFVFKNKLYLSDATKVVDVLANKQVAEIKDFYNPVVVPRDVIFPKAKWRAE